MCAVFLVSLLLVATSVVGLASAQEDACFCSPRPGWPTSILPLNGRPVMDATRFDPSTGRMVLNPSIGDPDRPGNLPVAMTTEPFPAEGVVFVRIEDPLLANRTYGLGVGPSDSYPDNVPVFGNTYDVIDYVDTTPPVIGDLAFTDEVFINNCGAQALLFEDQGTTDDIGTLYRLPVLVTLRSGDFEFSTVTATFGRTTTPVVVSKAPYLGRCITNEGLETLPIDFGDEVEITFQVYDHSGNESAPMTKTIAWPIRKSQSGGCAANAPGTPDTGTLAFVVAAGLWLARRRGSD